MSVFIQINEAIIDPDSVPDKIKLAIKSKDTVLEIDPITASETTLINHSLISSIKQKSLQFELTPLNAVESPQYKLTNDLSFSPLYFSAQKEINQILWFGKNIRVHLDIFFTKKKNFLGPIEFYQYQKGSSSSIVQPVLQAVLSQNIPLMPLDTRKHIFSGKNAEEQVTLQGGRPQIKNQVNTISQKDVEKQKSKKKGFFFCCGNEVDDKKYEVEDFQERGARKEGDLKSNASFPNQTSKRQEKQIQFYKGPCKSKNMFSVCDAPVNDNQYTIIEDHYKQRRP